MPSLNSLNCQRSLEIDGQTYQYFSLAEAAKSLGNLDRLPMSLKVLLENLLRFEDNATVSAYDIKAIVDWQQERRSDHEIQFRPARVLMQDFTACRRWLTWPPCAQPWPLPAAIRGRSIRCRRWIW